MKLKFTFVLTLALAGFTGCATAETPTTTNKPNVLFILVDDMGYMDIGANNPKCFYDMPNVDALAKRGLPQGPYEGYIDAFRYGLPPHGGFAIGLERWTGRLVGADNIREVTLFPRDLHRLSP